jgi:nucleoid-associated protein YgaU
MARTAKTTKTKKSVTAKKAAPKARQNVKAEIAATPRKNGVKDISEQLKLGESYISLILGAIVVLGLSVVFFLFVKETNFQNVTPPQDVEKVLPSTVLTQTPAANEQSYVMQDQESLWDVAVKFYGDGYRYTEIIEANQDIITNPDYVPPGTRIKIPNVK